MSRSRRKRPLAGSPPPPPGDGGPAAGPAVGPLPPNAADDPSPGGRAAGLTPEPGLVNPLATDPIDDDDDDDRFTTSADYPSGRVRVYPADPEEPGSVPEAARDAAPEPVPPLPPPSRPLPPQHEHDGPSEMTQGAPAAGSSSSRGRSRDDDDDDRPRRGNRGSGGGGRSPWPAALLGGLIGAGLTAGAGYYYLNTQPFVPPVLLSRLEAVEAGRGRVDALAAESGSLRERTETAASSIGSLQGRLAQVEQAGAAAPQRITSLEEGVRELRERLDGTRATTDTIAGDVRGRVDEVRARVDQLTAEVTRLAQAGGDLEATGRRLDGLDAGQRAAAGAAAEAKGAVDQLRTDLAALERRIGETQAAIRGEIAAARDVGRQELATLQGAFRGDLEGLRGETGRLGGRLQALEGLTGAVAALQQGGGSREAAIEQNREAVEALGRDLEQRLAAVRGETERTLAETRQRIVDETRAAQRDAELALAAFDLRSALERGGALGPGVALIRDAAGDDADLRSLADELAGLEGQGIPTVDQLARQLEQVAAEVDAPPPGEGPASPFDVARRNLTGLVDVRPAGAARTGQAAVEQARDALLAGDLAAAEAAITPLAEQSPAARAWLEAEARRKAAAGAVDRLAGRLKTDLSTQAQPPAAAN